MSKWQTWFVAVWATAVFVVSVLAFREYQQEKSEAQIDEFMCQLADEPGVDC